jgi:steroid 5-alpha reductase family enzyme
MIHVAALAVPIALVLSTPGFYRYVYFISVGYGLSVAGIAVGSAVAFGGGAQAVAFAHAALLAAYGLRLGAYLISREFKASFGGERAAIEKANAGIGLGKKLAIWIAVAVLYAVMAAPVALHLRASASGLSGGPLPWIGVAVGAFGLALESLADLQKSRLKKARPGDFASSGLYAWCRYPNYFGEMIVWLGSFIAGVSSFGADPIAWVASSVGLVSIWLVMLGSGKRLEEKQDDRYGDRPDYREYKARVPALIPVIGGKSLKNIKVYLG